MAAKWRLLSRLSPRTCLFAAIVALTFALTTPAIDHLDGSVRVNMAERMLHGRLDSQPDPGWPSFHAEGTDGRHYAVYGVGQPLLLIPLVAIGNTVGGTGPVRDAVIVLGYTALVNLLLAGACFGVLRQLRLSPRASAVGTLALFVISPWLIWGRSMQEEALTAALLLGALVGMLRWKSCHCLWWLLAAGLLAGFTANVRPNAVFMVLALFTWMVVSLPAARLKSAVVFIAGSAPSLALFFWWNAYRFGSPLKIGFDTNWSWDFGRFANLLVLPDYGLLWFAPLLLLLPLTRQRDGLRLLAMLMAAAFVAHSVFLAGLPQYVGHAVGVSWGPRYLMHGALLAGPLIWMAWLKARKHKIHRVGIALIVISATVQWAGLWFQPRLEYAQDEYRAEHDKYPIEPHPWLLRRFSNIAAWTMSDLDQYSFPKGTVEGADVLMTPDLPPLRIAASRRLDAGSGIVAAAWGWFMLWLGVAGGAMWLLWRPREPHT